jgi:ArsR family metal-binding transcriptional regulator
MLRLTTLGALCFGDIKLTEGWIKLHRKFREWGWYKKPETAMLFIELLLSANSKTQEWNGIAVNRGQVVTSRQHLSQMTGISEQSVRTGLIRLKSTSEITIKSTNKYTIITICNYDKYQTSKIEINQEINQQINNQSTSNQPATNHKQEVKKERSIIYPPFFDDFWKVYPKRNGNKVGKAKTLKLFMQLLNGDRELIIKAAENYAASKTAKEGFAKDPERFLKDDYWKDWIEAKQDGGESRIL